jgi:predicted helicase
VNPLETYLQEINEIHSTGANVKELSFYPALKDLLNAAGKELKPKVQSVMSMRNQGAGMPDGGLFTASQVRKKANEDSILEQVPERGVIEVKSPKDDVQEIAQSEQVLGYAQRYGLVLVTNLREFVLVKHEFENQVKVLEQYSLADDEAAFWKMARHPRSAAQEHGTRLMEFLKRALLYQAELTDPKDLAWFLASYARDAHALVDAAGDLPALGALRQSMQQALNMQFADERGEHFFRSTLVQTLFYGVFSAWVLWYHENPASRESFDWRLSTYKLKVPVIQSLFHQLSEPRQLQSLGLTKYLDLTGAALNRVNRAAFFSKFDAGQAVQYFYEPFLEAYDPNLRKELGVWYTPPEIVEYMVERVDRVLRSELNLQDGLANPNVYVLDPCCGTGAYPLEVLKRIAKTLKDKGENALLGYELKQAATKRIFGFELLPAPYVISHLQIGLLLQQHDSSLDEGERASVYLTNALTGWEPPKEPKQLVYLRELEEERDAANHVKRETPILVILGNPPYNAFAGVAETDEEKALVQAYKTGLREVWGIKKYNLDELYVRFVRLAEKNIVEHSGRGIVCYISSFSYLSDPSFVVMREHLLTGFDKFWFDCLNGDSRETGKTTPEGLPDPSVFSTDSNKEGIKLGTAIGLMVRHGNHQTSEVSVKFRQFWGVNKRADLLASLQAEQFESAFQSASPSKENRHSFRPSNVSEHYADWALLTGLSDGDFYQGLSEDRRKALIDESKNELAARMKRYFDKEITWEEYKRSGGILTDDYVDFSAKEIRAKALKSEKFDENNVQRYSMRPFDNQYCYYTPLRPVWRRNRPEYQAQNWKGNAFITARFKASKDPEGIPMSFIKGLCDYHYLTPNVIAIPFRLKKEVTQVDMFSTGQAIRANLSEPARAYLADLGIENPDSSEELEQGIKSYELIWYHALAIGYSPKYLAENADGIRDDYPRIPLPAKRSVLVKSAVLGRQIAVLLDTESQTSEVLETSEVSTIAVLRRVDGKQIQPQQGDLALTAGWGHAQGNIVMPGQGKVVQNGKSLDVYLNDKVYWQNIPVDVWEYVIGGYQVIKKWLAYREQKILRRDMTVEEVREVTDMARRIAAILSLQNQLDKNYQNVKSDTVKL